MLLEKRLSLKAGAKVISIFLRKKKGEKFCVPEHIEAGSAAFRPPVQRRLRRGKHYQGRKRPFPGGVNAALPAHHYVN